MEGVTLVVISPLSGFLLTNDKILLTQKFVEGMRLYRDLWGGPVLHLCEPATNPSSNLDNVEISRKNPIFDTYCGDLSRHNLRMILPKKSLVLTSVGERFNHISRTCRETGIPCVYVTEYSLKTRIQIAQEYQRNALHGAWSKLRQVQQEIAQRKAISIAAAVQCNGLPTYAAYRGLTPRPHLFFDSRVEQSILATIGQQSHLRDRKQLRLVFSGRINLMKGVDDLPGVADHLRRLGVAFHLTICGDGEYLPHLRKAVAERGLDGFVDLRGTLDFKSELMPFISNETDLFVCCHRQGDPSCTYIETMACGVPIIGYANEAWSELTKHSKCGWVTRVGDPTSMAETIAGLSRELIKREGNKSLEFARNHTFEDTFRARISHLKSVASSVF